jgi:membrane protease YdiL (CAAX protease family)
MLGLWVGAEIAHAAGAPDAPADVVTSSIFAAVAVGCAIAARAELRPLLASTGGWRGALAAVAAFGILMAFGAIYFPGIRALGFRTVTLTAPYVQAGWPRAAAYALLCFAPGVFEELTFRGYVMARLDRVLAPRETLLVQAALFSLLHLSVIIFPSHFVIGLVLGALRRRTRSLYPGMAVHIGWNATVVWAELAGRSLP